jgi:Leucine-rich repeat (LRR) protein
MKKNIILIAFLLFYLISCKNKKSNQEILSNKIKVNLDLKKSLTDTLEINWTRKLRKKYSFNYFSENDGICNLSNDSIFIRTDQGAGPSNTLFILISNGKFEIKLFENNCTYRRKYNVIKQSLELNKSNYKIDDTLTGKLFYQGIFVLDSIKNIVDTTTISGKFKLKIRNKDFDFDSLEKERRLSILNSPQPEKIKELNLSNWKINSLPKEIKKFRNLELLDLSENDLKNVDLNILSEFSKLKTIRLNNCNLSKIPNSICCLKNIEVIEIDHNNIKKLPLKLFKLTNIKELRMADNLLTSLPKEFLNLKKLKILDISSFNETVYIKNLPPDFFKTLTNLTLFYPPQNMDENKYPEIKNLENY